MLSGSITKPLWLAIVLLTAASNLAAQDSKTFLGLAYDQETGEPLYKALHQVELDEKGQYKRYRVDYASFTGKPIAHKDLSFKRRDGLNLFRPDLVFVDHRNQDQTATKSLVRGAVELAVTGEERELIEADAMELVVVDAGFDRLVMDRWDTLLKGQAIEFDFLALTRASLVGLELSQTSDQPPTSANRIRLQITASNWLLSMLMSPIVLEYDLETRNLMRYEGLTNIPQSDQESFNTVLDENYRAVIEYQYNIDDTKLQELASLIKKTENS